MARQIRVREQVEICEYYTDRFSISELAQMYDISEYQVQSILTKYKVPERTEPL